MCQFFVLIGQGISRLYDEIEYNKVYDEIKYNKVCCVLCDLKYGISKIEGVGGNESCAKPNTA